MYRLRWRFTFNDHKPDKIGVWNCVSGNPCDQAWSVNKTNLSRAIIEGEDEKGNVIVFVDCPAQEYVSMQCEAYTLVPKLDFKSYTGISYFYGLILITTEKKIKVRKNGKIVVTPLTEHDKKFDIREFYK
jgi:hypothetical protein